MAPLLLDTCAIVWTGHDQKMSKRSLEALATSLKDGAVYASPFSAWELSLLSSRGRLNLTMGVKDWFSRYLERGGVSLCPLDVSVLIAAHELPGSPPSDPADRILIATARQQGLAIVTRDRRIIDYGATGLVQTVVC